jgi:hypothetical protein
MRQINRYLPVVVLLFVISRPAMAQDSMQTVHAKPEKQYKNVIRYDLSGALLFGIDKYAVFGYERVIGPHQSISINVGPASLPKFIAIVTDSFSLSKDTKRSGFNVSVDYRFYLAKENRYAPPHGLYIGPYVSFNKFNRSNDWNSDSSSQSPITTNTDLQIWTVGGEIGYQFIVWKRLAIDLIMIGPGISNYNLHTSIENTLSEASKEQIQSALKQLLTQKFPGMNYVFSDKQFDASGNIRTWSAGYRYIIHIGFVF